MEENMKKNIYIYVYISGSLSFTAEINTALWINDILILKKKRKKL